MKNIKNIIFGLLSVMVFFGCDDKEKITLDLDQAKAPVILKPSSPDGLMFTKDDADNLIEFQWSAATYGIDVATTYSVEFSLTEDFAKVSSVITTESTTGSVLVSDINGILLALELPIGEESTIKCRVASSINTNVDNLYSPVLDFTVVPYETLVDYPMVFVPGAYQGWSPGEYNGRLYSYEFNEIYEGIIRITETADQNGEFKLNDGTNWLGGTLTAAGSNYSGTIGGDANFVVAPGTYSFKVNMSANTIELTKTDYWGVIGDAIGGWGDTDDVIMHYNGQRKVWEVTTDLAVGSFKFRMNNAWGGDLTGDADGNLTASGDNIEVSTAGSYYVVFDLNRMKYSFTPAE